MSLQRRLLMVSLVFLSTLAAGALGYRIIEGWPLLDAIYMSVITVTTVGFSEVRPLSPAGRVFTAILILLGVASITFSFGAISNYIVAGELRGLLGGRKMKRIISSMKNHVLVCGYGRMGHEVCRELQREGRDFVVLDEKEDSIRMARDEGYAAFHGDPGFDESLKECGIDRAAGLAATSDDDAKNLMVVLSARGLNPTLPIVARVSHEDGPEKFIRAGANNVFLPYRTGGRSMAQMILRPEVVAFIEDVLHDKSAIGLMIENLDLEPGSELDGSTLADAGIRERTGVYVLGIKRPGVGTIPDLRPLTELKAGDTLIVIGKKDQLDRLEKILAGKQK